MAKVSGIGVSSVQCIWRKHGLQPHRSMRAPAPQVGIRRRPVAYRAMQAALST
jgi:hypothetical protein